MKITEYRMKDAKNGRAEMNQLKYWCNACGELHHHGEYSITEEELPDDLRRAYNEVWTDGTASRCYLVEYEGEHGIALINEFDECFAANNDLTMDEVYLLMKKNAEICSKMPEFKEAKLICSEYSGFDECHELIVILPCNIQAEEFERIADKLEEVAYSKKNLESNMLVNDIKEATTHIKFISYTGEYPNLCRGILTLEINGERYKFGHNYDAYNMLTESFMDEDNEHPNFNKFWNSGGEVGFLDNYSSSYTNKEDWILNVSDIPEQFRKYATEIDEVFNDNVPHGCCGGCL